MRLETLSRDEGKVMDGRDQEGGLGGAGLPRYGRSGGFSRYYLPLHRCGFSGDAMIYVYTSGRCV